MDTNQHSLIEAAHAYLNAGLSILPCKPDKHPSIGAWRQYQRLRASLSDADTWFAHDGAAIGVIGGKISGNLNMIDFDNRGELFDAWCELVESQCSGLCGKLPIESTQSGGRHAFYRTEIPVEGNLKLARRAYECQVGVKEFVLNGKTLPVVKRGNKNIATVDLIETRGEGGYCLVAPSRGYQMLFGSLTAIPILSAHEHEVILNSARALNEYQENSSPFESSDERQEKEHTSTEDKPGADFIKRGDIRPILEKHGWTRLSNRGIREYWCRPGKRGAVSASLTEGAVWWVFSSNGAPFEIEKGYNKFAVYALLEHQGKFADAARALAAQGYGKQTRQKKTQTTVEAEAIILRSILFKDRVEQTISGEYFACEWPWFFTGRLTKALLPGTITILCAPKGASKSFMLLQAMMSWWDKDYKPAALMLEDNAIFHLTRALAQHIGNGEITDPEWTTKNPNEARKLAAEYAPFMDRFGECIDEARGGWTTQRILHWLKLKAQTSRIIAIDPITAKTPSAKPWDDDHNFMCKAAEIVSDTGTSLILVTHPPKSVAGPNKMNAWGDDVAGGMAFQNFSQTILWLEYMTHAEDMVVKNQMGVCEAQVNRVLQLRKTRNAAGQGFQIGFYFDPKTLTFAEQGIIQDE